VSLLQWREQSLAEVVVPNPIVSFEQQT
jgi:hypothetical protein